MYTVCFPDYNKLHLPQCRTIARQYPQQHLKKSEKKRARWFDWHNPYGIKVNNQIFKSFNFKKMATTEKGQSGHSNQGSHSKSQGGNSGNFANMDDKKQKEAASKGGKSSHSGNKSH